MTGCSFGPRAGVSRPGRGYLPSMPLCRALGESVVVVTGASSGIGAATAQALAERQVSVVLAARRPDALSEVAARCVARGGAALPRLQVPDALAEFGDLAHAFEPGRGGRHGQRAV